MGLAVCSGGPLISVRTERGEETLALEEFEARVKQGEIAPSTPVRFPVLTGERWVDARDLEVFRRLYAPARIYFARAFTLGGFPVITTGLVLAQVVIFFVVAGAQRALSLDPLIDAGAKVQPNILELGETWRLLTANVLHRDVLHLLFNMFFLFNVGGTIENAYRKQDYALILVSSALSTTLLSTLMSSVPSVGASGMVLGLFGSSVVFGYKYSDILPRRYRRYFGGAVLPYALFILYVGLATKDTDNWGHLGGLIGGFLAAIPLEPKLLHLGKQTPAFVVRSGPALVAATLIAGVLAAGPMLRAAGPTFSVRTDADKGYAIEFPARWGSGENHLGYLAFGNALGASIGVAAQDHRNDPDRRVPLAEMRRRFLEQELARHEAEGDVTRVRVLDERPLIIEGARAAVELVIGLESRAGLQRTRNILIERGFYSYAIVLSAPEAWARSYGPIFDQMAARIRLIEPARLARARASASTFPGMSSAHVELGNELAAIGDVKRAAEAYQRALQALPEHEDALYGLAKLAADFGGDLAAAEAIAARLYERRPDEATYAVLLADLRERLGQLDGARAVIQETLDRNEALARTPEAEELRKRLSKLR